MRESVAEAGETRPANYQYCNLHTQKSSHRRFSRDIMSKSSVSLAASSGPDGFVCPGCSKVCKSKSGLSTHRRFCKSPSTSDVPSGPALEPLLKMHDIRPQESKAYKKKISHWLLLRKNRELKNGTLAFRSQQPRPSNDVQLKVNLKRAATCIVGCISGDHSNCLLHSFVCKDGLDPYLYLLPHGRPIHPMPASVKTFIQESISDLFSSAKLDRLIYQGKLETTSRVEAVHRTIRCSAPKVGNENMRICAIGFIFFSFSSPPLLPSTEVDRDNRGELGHGLKLFLQPGET